MHFLSRLALCSVFFTIASCSNEEELEMDSISMDQNENIQITELPFDQLELKDLEAFESEGDNWKIVGGVYADFEDPGSFDLEEGTGILANKMGEQGNNAIRTKMEHGDLHIKFEYLVPKGSNSGMYFQGRYELQIFDSYGVKEPGISDSGAIYERWDDSRGKGKEGFEGHPPSINSSKAPGLWQQIDAFFRAPKFDRDGRKIANAKFDHVYHNGILVHENIELTGPTRGPFLDGEAPYGPLIIQGDHGNVAFRNISYKSYTQDSLVLSNISYQYFEHPDGVVFPNFDTVRIVKEGGATSLDPSVANEKEDHYGLIFNAELQVPVTGNYLFYTGIDEGGDLLINDSLIIHNEGNPGFDEVYGQVYLEKGTHPFEFRYYDDTWISRILMDYEGPGIYRRSLANHNPRGSSNKEDAIQIKTVQETEMIRSFVMYNDKKRTHAISVGSPEGIHYSYDLHEGALLKFWGGDFADLTDMWRSRGEPQILMPLNAALEATDGFPFKSIKDKQVAFQGYEINENGQPVFHYKSEGMEWKDVIYPSKNERKLNRTIELLKSDQTQDLVLVKSDQIKLLPNGLYSVSGQYYIESPDATLNGKELTVKMDANSSTTYKLFW
ncbi:family 16 glycoside hydrolase [Portibacter marinus]|uniref:family 16 glycoside hydrolase n=1 Tax=Portibacter marinus TaxID=2898660 RepID=UPI001F1DFD36|nr:family 16 glycoside hydrolase [Portibacter marinus]